MAMLRRAHQTRRACSKEPSTTLGLSSKWLMLHACTRTMPFHNRHGRPANSGQLHWHVGQGARSVLFCSSEMIYRQQEHTTSYYLTRVRNARAGHYVCKRWMAASVLPRLLSCMRSSPGPARGGHEIPSSSWPTRQIKAQALAAVACAPVAATACWCSPLPSSQCPIVCRCCARAWAWRRWRSILHLLEVLGRLYV